MANNIGNFIHHKQRNIYYFNIFIWRQFVILLTFSAIFYDFKFHKHLSVCICQTCVKIIHIESCHYSSLKWVQFDEADGLGLKSIRQVSSKSWSNSGCSPET